MRLINNASAVILASGLSSRMKKLKPLLPLGSSSVINCAISCFIKAGVADIAVVLGHRAAEIIPELEPLNVRVVINDEYREGMYSSVQRGAAALGSDVEAFFLLPGDYPMIKPETISKIYAAYEGSQRGIIHPTYLKQRGHPPLISGKYREKVLAGREEEGLKSFLRKHEHDSIEVEVEDSGILFDLDTPAEYRKALREYISDIPDRDTCLTLLRYFGASQKVVNHSLTVASLTEKLGAMLTVRGYPLDPRLIIAGALLHDLAKGLPEHALIGAKRVKALGMCEVAAIVAEHMDLIFNPREQLSEAALVYLADKMTNGDRIVSLRERFIEAVERHRNETLLLNKIELRYKSAHAIMCEITRITGRTILSDELADHL